MSEWLSLVFSAWLIWNVIAPVAVAALALAIFVFPRATGRAWRQSRCAHESYSETAACDAVCNACGKNLGFIGAVKAGLDKT